MKYQPHGSVHMLTFSIEEGKLLLSNPLCEALIKSALARAQEMYPVKVCAFLIESTHVHMIVVVVNPSHLSDFIRYFKTETAHALNRILGRKKRTIWCEGFDSPTVLTPVRTIIALAYIYSNPAKDGLEDTIDQYPGMSSWQMFRNDDLKKRWKWLHRSDFSQLPATAHTLEGYTKEAQRILASAKMACEFVLEPNAWMEAFGITRQEDFDRINKTIVDRVRTLEERHRKRREIDGKRVIGAERLRREKLDTTWRPQRRGKRMLCLSESRRLRIAFISFLKALFKKARAIRERWKVGDYSIPYPPGLFPPLMPKLVEPMSLW
jgi:REP element-mobilizing transposase RayT